MLRIGERVFAANLDNRYVYAMYDFGLEECNRLEEAEAAGGDLGEGAASGVSQVEDRAAGLEGAVVDAALHPDIFRADRG